MTRFKKLSKAKTKETKGNDKYKMKIRKYREY